jgi:hypothetical protein
MRASSMLLEVVSKPVAVSSREDTLVLIWRFGVARPSASRRIALWKSPVSIAATSKRVCDQSKRVVSKRLPIAVRRMR